MSNSQGWASGKTMCKTCKKWKAYKQTVSVFYDEDNCNVTNTLSCGHVQKFRS